jgi:hypothetical protein
MKKAINTIFAAVAIVGVFAAVCVTDGSNHEMAVRLIGTLAFVAGLVGWSLTSTETEKQ